MRTQRLEEVRDEALQADLVVVGTGPAGMTIARELSGSGADVLLLESGGLRHDDGTAAEDDIESVGAPRVLDQRRVRNHGFGGTSHSWSGRAVQFDDIDFDRRPWVPQSGWPISRKDLEPYFARAAAHLGAPFADNADPDLVARVTAELPPADPILLRPYAWVLSQDAADSGDSMRFGPRALKEAMPGTRALLGATAVEVLVSPGGRAVVGLVVAGSDGTRRTVRCSRVVLAAGGLENPRLLLASTSVVPSGVGNGRGLVGRYLMDHPRGPLGLVDRRDHAGLQRRFGDRFPAEGGRATPGWALAAELQQRESLTNCAAWLFPVVHAEDPFTAARAIRRAPAGAAAAIARYPVMLANGLARMRMSRSAPVRLLERLELHVIVEQAPDPNSRLTLSGRRDRLGVPLARIDWRVGAQEVRTARRTARLVARTLEHSGAHPVRLLPAAMDEEPFDLPDTAHPMGATRMANDPADGVVDEHCAVHGVQGLWVAGSSVFPTGSHANPTGTIVAFAVRLADRLRTELR